MTDAERLAAQDEGFALVMLHGSNAERAEACARRAYVREINRQTEVWMEQQWAMLEAA